MLENLMLESFFTLQEKLVNRFHMFLKDNPLKLLIKMISQEELLAKCNVPCYMANFESPLIRCSLKHKNSPRTQPIV